MLPDGAEYVEDRMGLTITSIWRLLVKDMEDTLDATCDQARPRPAAILCLSAACIRGAFSL